MRTAVLVLLCTVGCTELKLAARPEAPAPSAKATLRLPKIQHTTLPSGLQLYVIEEPYLPLVSVRLALFAGSGAVAPAQAGLAPLAYQLLLQGSESQDVDLALYALGAGPRVRVGPDGADVALTARAADLPRALELVGEALQHPRFAEEDFVRLKRTQLAELGALADWPDYVGQAVALRAIYGTDHPYGNPPMGTPASVAGLRREDVLRFHRRFTGPRNAALVLAGRVTMAQALSLCRDSLGAWVAGTETVPVPPQPAARRRDRVLLVPRPGLPQTLILIGKAVVPAGHADELPLSFVHGVPAAWSSGRLVRDRGDSYGISSGLSLHRGAGHMLTASWMQADATRGGLRELLRRYGDGHDLLRGSDEGMYEGRARAAFGLMSGLDSVGGVADAAAHLFLLGRPPDYYLRLHDALLELRAGEVQPAAHRYLGPETLQVVLVGDPEVVRQQVGPLNLGPVELVTGL